MSKLQEMRCKPCEGGTDPLPSDRALRLLQQVPGWDITEDKQAIFRRFEFRGFYRTMSFINAIAWIANHQGHHPDFSAGYNYCEVAFTTHAIHGLSENDFICASRVNALLED